MWVTGAIWSVRSEAGRFRPVGIACVLAIVLQFVLGGKAYYPGGAYTFLLAAGCVSAERWLAARRLAANRPLAGQIGPAPVLAGAMLAGALIAAPVTLPVLPARALHTAPVQKINYDLGEEIAWPKLVALVSREYHALPPAQRQQATILTGNYGGVFTPSTGTGRLGAAGLQRRTTWLGARRPRPTLAAIAVSLTRRSAPRVPARPAGRMF